MITMTLKQAANILNVSTPKSDATFKGLSIDTRTLQANNLFIALPGENVDGHDYLQQAQDKGAAAALVSKQCDTNLPQLIVPDVTKALGQLSTAWRQQFKLPIVAVTGSNGKTTTKNMIAAIMKAACDNDSKVLATKGNLNNHLGLPLTLSQLNQLHRYAIIEMGMNHFNEISYLTHLTQPDVALITNAGPCHLDGVGDLAGVAKAKAEIFEGLSASGIAVLNRDDDFFDYWLKQIGKHKFITFGFHKEANVSAVVKLTPNGQQLFLHTPIGDTDLTLPLLGRHNVLNALAAAAAAIPANIDIDTIKKGLESVLPTPGRMEIHPLNDNVTLIDDTYNANPSSLKAAIDTLKQLPGKKILVLGDMKELGENAAKLHYNAGQEAKAAGVDHLFTCGDLSQEATAGFGSQSEHFHEQTQLNQALLPYLSQNATILVKGSRSMKMEQVVKKIVQYKNNEKSIAGSTS